jgi:hypothetical protein
MGARLDQHEGRDGESSLTRLRRWSGLACWLVFASMLWACGDWNSAQDEVAAAGPERIILIVADTLRRDHLSPYGSELETPAVAGLARRGQVFTNAVASFHQTTMSMAAMFTGRTPSLETGDRTRTLPWTSANWCGLSRLGAGDGESCIPRHLATLAEDLRGAGYETLGVASNRLIFRPHGYEQGFDAWVELGEKQVPKTPRGRAEEAMLRTGTRVNQATFELLARRASNRFFLYVHYMDPHEHWFRRDLPTYADGVVAFDRALGSLLGRLEAKGLLEDAVIIFTSDHGELLGAQHALPATKTHFGNPSFDPLLLVPLIVAPPTKENPQRLLRSQDLRGLVRSIAGLEPGAPADLEPDELFYRRGRFKSMWSRDGEKMALFDLLEDPGETRDVSAEHPEIVARHRDRLRELTINLGTRRGEDAERSVDDEERLRALGYIE